MKKYRMVVSLLGLLVFASGCQSISASSFSSSAQESSSAGSSSTSASSSQSLRSNSEGIDYSSIIVNGPTNSLNASFAYGADLSIVHEVEEAGGVYYNEEGEEEDIFKILAADGVNYARFRLWVNPYSLDGKAYGGGTNDVATDVALAVRAKAAGMKVLIDFHYSDFWSDPDTYWIPKTWADVYKSQLGTTIAEYTTASLTSFKDAGVTVDAVQIGNETTYGFCGTKISGTSSYTYVAGLFNKAITAAKSVFPDVLSIIQLSNGSDYDTDTAYFESMDANNVDYDICGFSYYPYWHGTKAKLQSTLNAVAAQTGKPVMICEAAWGFTDEANDNCSNIYNGSTYESKGGYLTSPQAQATVVSDLVDILSKVPDEKGLGIFYWEPDWLPVSGGAYWATAAGQSYDAYGNDNYSVNYSVGLNAWANQAWFSYSGKALASAATYRHIQNLDKTSAEVVERLAADELSVTLNLADPDHAMPTTVSVITNTQAYRDAVVTWNAEEVAAMEAAGAGTYQITGTAGEFVVTATVTCEANYVLDPGFEGQLTSTDVVGEPWVLTKTPSADKVGHIDRKTDMRSGSADFNWYDTSDFAFTISQTITGLTEGTYALTTYILSQAISENGGISAMSIFVTVGDDTFTLDCLSKCIGWSSGYQQCQLTDIDIPSSVTGCVVGLSGVCGAKSWGHNDDWSLVKTV
jgi:arabinogalactan endo-1,4-beta-galactosidase